MLLFLFLSNCSTCMRVGTFLKFLLVAAASCPAYAGTEPRSITADVTSISVTGPITVNARQGATPSLSVTADADILPHIVTTVQGSQLSISFDGTLNLNIKTPVTVSVSTPQVKALGATGSASIDCSGYSSSKGKIELSAAGSSDLSFKGDFADVQASASGSSKITVSSTTSGYRTSHVKAVAMGSSTVDASGLEADAVHVDLSGSSDASVRAVGSAQGSVSGSSALRVAGSPAREGVTADVSSTVKYSR